MSCIGCRYRKNMSNPHSGVKITTGEFGKCIREGGFCDEKRAAKAGNVEVEIMAKDRDGSNGARSAEVAAVEEVYAAGRRDADKAKAELEAVRKESEALGKIKAAKFYSECSELLKYMTLYQIRQEKSYKNEGRTWEDFCVLIGESRRTVDAVLSDIRPLIDKFSATSAENFGVPINKIRYLGREVSAGSAEVTDDAIIIDDHRIELKPENKDELEAAIDALKDTHSQERTKHEKEVERLKKKIDDVTGEEVKNLRAEKKGLLEELKTYKLADPEDKDLAWSEDQMQEVLAACTRFGALCLNFMADERLEEHIELQAQVEGLITHAEKALSEVRKTWFTRFGGYQD